VTRSRIASRVSRIKPSPSGAAADRAAELRRAGQSIISLVVGEPDFDTPPAIRAAAARAVEAGATRYTASAGTLELRQAIVEKLRDQDGLDYATSEIIVTSGAKSAIYSALAATLEAGDEVIIPAPYWVSYPDMVLANDGTPVPIACAEAQGFKLVPAQLEAAITPSTRWLVLNSPSNPTGAIYGEEEYRALADVLARHPDVMVMTDDIYEHIRFDGRRSVHLLACAPELRDRTLAVNGVSKTYAMTGWRIGWAAGPRDLIVALETLLSQSAGNCSAPGQAAAAFALRGDQSFVAESVTIYRQRRDRAAQRINAIAGLRCPMPEGAFYLYVNCAGLIGRKAPDGRLMETDGDVAMYLLEEAGVAVVAGSAYGLSPYFRVSIATSMDNLMEGCDRMAKAVAKLGTAGSVRPGG
jgi:aspartate aminotransferase